MSNRMAVAGRGHEVMSRYSALLLAVLCATAAPVVVSTAAAQAPASDAGKWEVPRTPDGHPDLQGNWTNVTLTPFEREEGEEGKGAVFTADEVARLEQELQERIIRGSEPSDPDRPAPTAGASVGTYNQVFFDRGDRVAVVDGEPRSSLVTHPANGRRPSLTPEAERRIQEYEDFRSQFGQYDHPELRPLGERCIINSSTSNPAGPPMVPKTSYNGNFTIVQTADHVMIMVEMIHDTRIIRIGDGPRLPPHIRPWFGDSWGRWEGDALVIETTNINPQQSLRGVPPSEHMRVTERFTRVDEETILYEFTVEDPTMYTQAWGGEIPIKKLHDRLYEYACQEGNYALSAVLSGARYQERMEAQGTSNFGGN